MTDIVRITGPTHEHGIRSSRLLNNWLALGVMSAAVGFLTPGRVEDSKIPFGSEKIEVTQPVGDARYLHYNAPLLTNTAGLQAEAEEKTALLEKDRRLTTIESIDDEFGDPKAVAQKIADIVQAQRAASANNLAFSVMIHTPRTYNTHYGMLIGEFKDSKVSDVTASRLVNIPGFTALGRDSFGSNETQDTPSTEPGVFTEAVKKEFEQTTQESGMEGVAVDIIDSGVVSVGYTADQYQQLINLARSAGFGSIGELDYAAQLDPELADKIRQTVFGDAEKVIIVTAKESPADDSYDLAPLCAVDVQPVTEEFHTTEEKHKATFLGKLAATTITELAFLGFLANRPFRRIRVAQGIYASTEARQKAAEEGRATPEERLRVIAYRHLLAQEEKAGNVQPRYVNKNQIYWRLAGPFLLGMTVSMVQSYNSTTQESTKAPTQLTAAVPDAALPQIEQLDSCDPSVQVVEVMPVGTERTRQEVFVLNKDNLPDNLTSADTPTGK